MNLKRGKAEVVLFFWGRVKVGLGRFYSFALEYVLKVRGWT